MDIYASAVLWRRPDASPVMRDHGWTIAFRAPAVAALPRDVRRVDESVGPKPIRLRESLHDVVGSLRDAVRDDLQSAEQALRLAEHYRRFGNLDLCVHARPIWHLGQGRDSCHRFDDQLTTVVTFVRALEALEEGGLRASKRQDLSPWVVEQLEPLLPIDFAPVIRQEGARDGRLSAPRRRQVLELAGTRLLEESSVRPRVLWSKGRGPGLALVPETAVGLYALDVVRSLGRDEEPPSYVCSVCGAPVHLKRPPTAGEGVYCRRQECQRARYRINKRRARARAKEERDVQ